MEEGEGLGVSREGRIAQTRLLAKTRVAWFPFGKGAPLFRSAGDTQSGVSKPLSAELPPGASGPLNVGRRFPRLPGGWGLRGGAQGSQNQAPVPLEDPGMNAEGVVGVRRLLPGPLPSPPGRTPRAAGAEVFWQLRGGQVPAQDSASMRPPGVAGGRGRKRRGRCPPFSLGAAGYLPERRQAVFSLSFLFKSFPASAVSCHTPWRPPRGTRGHVVSQDSGKKPQGDRDKGNRALMGQGRWPLDRAVGTALHGHAEQPPGHSVPLGESQWLSASVCSALDGANAQPSIRGWRQSRLRERMVISSKLVIIPRSL